MPAPTIDEAVTRFRRDGYLLVEDALTPAQLDALRAELDGWIAESRAHGGAYGETLDGRPRFDLEPGHGPETPGLRRVSSPTEISAAYRQVMRDNGALDLVAALIGPNVRLNNSKVNSKLPGTATEVRFHQDFAFEPHSNDDLITVLLFLDDVTAENGPLEVVPGSHRGPLHAHWHDGVFTGAVSPDVAAAARCQAVLCLGPAGSACLMHSRLLHGSRPNLAAGPRSLYIVAYVAEDAVPLVRNAIPSRHEGEIVRGVRSGRARATSFEMALPEHPEGASFFAQQAKATAGG